MERNYYPEKLDFTIDSLKPYKKAFKEVKEKKRREAVKYYFKMDFELFKKYLTQNIDLENVKIYKEHKIILKIFYCDFMYSMFVEKDQYVHEYVGLKILKGTRTPQNFSIIESDGDFLNIYDKAMALIDLENGEELIEKLLYESLCDFAKEIIGDFINGKMTAWYELNLINARKELLNAIVLRDDIDIEGAALKIDDLLEKLKCKPYSEAKSSLKLNYGICEETAQYLF